MWSGLWLFGLAVNCIINHSWCQGYPLSLNNHWSVKGEAFKTGGLQGVAGVGEEKCAVSVLNSSFTTTVDHLYR